MNEKVRTILGGNDTEKYHYKMKYNISSADVSFSVKQVMNKLSVTIAIRGYHVVATVVDPGLMQAETYYVSKSA